MEIRIKRPTAICRRCRRDRQELCGAGYHVVVGRKRRQEKRSVGSIVCSRSAGAKSARTRAALPRGIDGGQSCPTAATCDRARRWARRKRNAVLERGA